jgi:hypothetical protein
MKKIRKNFFEHVGISLCAAVAIGCIIGLSLTFAGSENLGFPARDGDGQVGKWDRRWGDGYFKNISVGSAYNTVYRTDTVTITNAEIKALRGSKKDLIAAPGVDKYIEFISAIIILDYGSDVLTESEDNLVIQYGSGTDVSAAIEAGGFIDAAADTMVYVKQSGDVAGTATATFVNDEIELFNTGDGEYGGNATADTTMTVKVTYRIHDFGLD